MSLNLVCFTVSGLHADDLSVRLSKPVVTEFAPQAGGFDLTWFSVPTKTYTVQFAAALGSPTNEQEKVMAKVIRCQCGFLGRGESAEEAATVIEAHMRADHPELVGKVTREDVIAMAEEA